MFSQRQRKASQDTERDKLSEYEKYLKDLVLAVLISGYFLCAGFGTKILTLQTKLL